MTNPFELTATDAIKLIGNNKLSRYEWVQSCLERIREKEDLVKAWVYLDEDRALEKAKQLDNENNESQLGIPFGIKDIIDASNTPTGFGTSFYQNNVPMRDAASVAVAKKSGCIFIGKTVSTELGHRALCPNSVDTVLPIKIHPDFFATATEAASLIGTLF